MPCSGLRSATSVRFFAACSRSMVDVPSRATPVWLVSSATLAPASRAKPSARSTSIPVRTGARGAASPARAGAATVRAGGFGGRAA